MSNIEEPIFIKASFNSFRKNSNVIKAKDLKVESKVKLSFEEDYTDGVKIILHKDQADNLKEIKFICSCGQTKTIALDYSEE